MSQVASIRGEGIDTVLKRLKHKVEVEGTLEEVRCRRAYETPTQKKQRKEKLRSRRRKLNLDTDLIQRYRHQMADRLK
jgi:small subunit ribosomal protein S21